MAKISNELKHKMDNVDIGRYNNPKLSFSVIASTVFWFFVPFIISFDSYWHIAYLKSRIWNYRRKKILLRDNFKCTVCDQTLGPMDVHHITYDRICREQLEDLRTVCRYHHRKIHNKHR